MNGYKIFYACTALVLVTVAVFEPVRRNGFVNFDDDDYITFNEHVKKGLSPESVKWAFASTVSNHWHPVTWLSHIMDCQLFGLDAGKHHLANLIFHAANGVLLFLLFNAMTGRFWPSAFAAAAFALHPLHVESVAWASGRKDTLSTLFLILSVMCYVRYAKGRHQTSDHRPQTEEDLKSKVSGRRSQVWYAACLAAYAFGLMCKSMLVTTPIVLMLLDVWPLGRFRALSEQKGSLKAVFYLVFDKLPFFALSVAAGIITFVLQRAAGNLMTSEKMPRVVCIANAAVSYMKYIGKMLWPVDLAVLYPHPFHHLNMYAAAVFFLLLVFISVLAVRLAARYGYIFTGWFWYLVTLLPVIGIVQVGSQAMADRYSYVPLTGIFIIAAWGISDFTAKWPYRRFILSFAAVVVLTAMSVCTRMQLRYWRDSVSLSLRATQVTMDNYVAYSNLGAAYGELGRTADTIEAFRRAIKINPDFAEAYYNLGVTYAGLDRWQEAMGAFKEAVRIRPDFAEARYNLGIIYEKLGLKQEQAAEVHKDAAEPKPEDAQTYYKLGNSYNRQGRYTEAIEALNKAVQIKPGFSDAYYNLGVNYWSLDRYEEAAEAYRQAVKADPGNVDAYFNLGMTCGRLGRLPEAIEAFRQVVGIMPNDLEAHSNLGFAYLTSGDKESARKEYEVLKTLDEQKAAQLLAAIERQ